MRVIKAPSIVTEIPERFLPPIVVQPTTERNENRKIALPTMEGIHFEKIKNIVSLEASGNYTILRFEDKHQLLVCKTLRNMEALLDEHKQFIRIHRSFTINLSKLQKYIKGKGGYVLMENGETINVSIGKKQAFLNAIKLYFG